MFFLKECLALNHILRGNMHDSHAKSDQFNTYSLDRDVHEDCDVRFGGWFAVVWSFLIQTACFEWFSRFDSSYSAVVMNWYGNLLSKTTPCDALFDYFFHWNFINWLPTTFRFWAKIGSGLNFSFSAQWHFSRKKFYNFSWVPTAGWILVMARTNYDACAYCCDLMLYEKIVRQGIKIG